MFILAIETTGPKCSVALLESSDTNGEAQIKENSAHGNTSQPENQLENRKNLRDIGKYIWTENQCCCPQAAERQACGTQPEEALPGITKSGGTQSKSIKPEETSACDTKAYDTNACEASDLHIIQKFSAEKMNHLKSVTEMIRQVLEEAKIKLKDVDYIAVSVGPGSFTGIRIGVSTARALAQVSGKKLIPIPTLEAFGKLEAENFSGKVVCPIINARRNQIYGAAYGPCSKSNGTAYGLESKDSGASNNMSNKSNGAAYRAHDNKNSVAKTVPDLNVIAPANPYDLDEFLELLVAEDEILFVGDGVDAYGEKIDRWATENDKDITFGLHSQTAEGVAKLGLQRVLNASASEAWSRKSAAASEALSRKSAAASEAWSRKSAAASEALSRKSAAASEAWSRKSAAASEAWSRKSAAASEKHLDSNPMASADCVSALEKTILTDCNLLQPEYMREAEAQRKLKERKAERNES